MFACLAVVQLALFTSKPIAGKEFFFVLLFKISYKTIHKISVQESYKNQKFSYKRFGMVT